MNRRIVLLCLLFQSVGLTFLGAQNKSASGATTDEQTPAGAEVVSGPKGFLNIDYKGGRFLTPYQRIISVSRHNYLVDGGGMVHELTIDTEGTVIARYYYMESPLENNPLQAAQIIDNRLKKVRDLVEERTGQDTDVAVKFYPQTTHAKTIEFKVSSLEQLEWLYARIYDDWVVHGGRNDGRTIRIQ